MSDFKIPKPIDIGKYPMYFDGYMCGCDCSNQPKEKTDCFFYEEVKDMGAHIPTCNYHHKLGYCPCDGCMKYIKHIDVSNGVRKYVDEYPYAGGR